MSVTTLAPMLELLDMEDLENLNLPDPVSGTDKLRSIYRRPGPYTTVYLARRPLLPGAEADTAERWATLRADLEAQCAPVEALTAIDARLALPAPEDTSAIAVIAAPMPKTTGTMRNSSRAPRP